MSLTGAFLGIVSLIACLALQRKFSKAFDVKFKNKNGEEEYAYITCYGPAISRILASVIITHGDDKGLKFPWHIAPKQVVITTVSEDKLIKNKAKQEKNLIDRISIVLWYNFNTNICSATTTICF